MKKIPLFSLQIDSKEIESIKEALEQKNKRDELEKSFAQYIGCPHSLATSNETASLHLAMTTIDLKRGDKILCSVNSYPNVPEVVRHFDAEPIFVDICPDDFNIDLDELEKILSKNKSKKLKGAIISHIAGQPTDLDRLYEIAREYNILIIEDASNALGATYNGNKIGSLEADITTFSFNPHKRFTTNNGGMMCLKNEELEERARLLQRNAMVRSEWDEEGHLGYIYDVVDIGLEYDMSDLEAAFNLSQLQKNDAAIERRRQIAAIYHKELANTPHIELPKEVRDHIYSLFIIKIDKNRDSFARELYKRGIEVGLHYIPLHLLSYYKQKYSLRINDFPKALRNYQQILSIPIHSGMSDEDVYYVIEQIKEVAQSRV
ncbi:MULTISPECIES: DegT/DnrJ/EryC1/StrS aminotransferase family protein [unclassified Nitratiruptor]|uniref:DegT/DnrJ/EryC1/StrS family aminotransferase n=1 Tax=unclassified Nitratiruptor TaxID=2624044 RepID=UPI001916A994|nr:MULTISPECIES: DegT/DnrJ/EryC1/StrS family aminotransferase [unclassified Nitratiruptor]BCD60240.1 UDP-4-amino-4-deoxy-L-arabinose--oxoglutarate aminotransferase [Nitratiruptor sp. YY08-10]BCD64271.1 UDP-4-amino-4-deoxy-L-arabinose--oxoglutarate aminotransferase [Nitratiruptor sp. YY08-14]